MAASSSSSPVYREAGETQLHHHHQQQQGQQQHSSAAAPSNRPQKKKRSLPGTPNGDAEVIALSPKSLMATNRFICEVCKKGFQREQNLQLHRRGHNLPWKLKQKTNKEEVKKRKVYLCPEPTCVHHDPARALGDLTGIKKHYYRKHGDKKFKCLKCSKRYALHSDCKPHSKTCGTRDYRCDCGTLFSRRDSFITHRAFCDALAQESARHPTTASSTTFGIGTNSFGPPPPNNNITATDILRLSGGPAHFNHLLGPTFRLAPPPPDNNFYLSSTTTAATDPYDHQQENINYNNNNNNNNNNNSSSSNSSSVGCGMFSNKLFSGQLNHLPDLQGFFSNGGTTASAGSGDHNSALFSTTTTATTGLFGGHHLDNSVGLAIQASGSSGPHMSATALLQKAAQMGSTSGGSCTTALFQGFDPKPDRWVVWRK